MNGKTSKQRLARKAELANKPKPSYRPITQWLDRTDENIARLEEAIVVCKLPGSSIRKVIEETINGKKTGRIALARKI